MLGDLYRYSIKSHNRVSDSDSSVILDTTAIMNVGRYVTCTLLLKQVVINIKLAKATM